MRDTSWVKLTNCLECGLGHKHASLVSSVSRPTPLTAYSSSPSYRSLYLVEQCFVSHALQCRSRKDWMRRLMRERSISVMNSYEQIILFTYAYVMERRIRFDPFGRWPECRSRLTRRIIHMGISSEYICRTCHRAYDGTFSFVPSHFSRCSNGHLCDHPSN